MAYLLIVSEIVIELAASKKGPKPDPKLQQCNTIHIRYCIWCCFPCEDREALSVGVEVQKVQCDASCAAPRGTCSIAI